VKIFIDAFIDSIDLLRVVLALAKDPGRKWTASEMTQTVGFSLAVTSHELEKACRLGFASQEAGEPPTFCYHPRAAEFDQMIRELIELDNHMPVTLIRMVYSRPRPSTSAAQAFAEAFRLRKP
jgi:hypothetical protein